MVLIEFFLKWSLAKCRTKYVYAKKGGGDSCDKIKDKRTKIPVGIYLLKVNNKNTRTRCEICSKLTIKTSERYQWRRSGVFIVNFKHI